MADTRTLSCSSLSELPKFAHSANCSAQSAKLVVPLQSDVVYVTGTVNAVPTTWTRGDGDAWTTTADRSADDVYRVELEMITAAGRTYTAAVTLYYGLLNLITDRTQADADEVKRLAAKGYAAMTAEEKAAWDAGLKGAYNASDLNRVGSAVGYVAGRLTDAGYGIDVSPHVGWTEGGIPDAEEAAAYLASVAAVRAVLAGALPGLPALPEDMDRLTFAEANAIEQVLLDVNAALDRIRAGAYYAGELYANDV